MHVDSYDFIIDAFRELGRVDKVVLWKLEDKAGRSKRALDCHPTNRSHIIQIMAKQEYLSLVASGFLDGCGCDG